MVGLWGDKNASRPKHRQVSPVTELEGSSQRMRDGPKSPLRSLVGTEFCLSHRLGIGAHGCEHRLDDLFELAQRDLG